MTFWDPDKYTEAWNFASHAHEGQTMPGSKLPYINHVGSVSMEVANAIARSDDIQRPNLLIQCALLHDVIEDTRHTYNDIADKFGTEVADGVLALSKQKGRASKMQDSLDRIKKQPREIRMVKMADRITNLQPPPDHWSDKKVRNYKDEASLILYELGSANRYLSQRLSDKIQEYEYFRVLKKYA